MLNFFNSLKFQELALSNLVKIANLAKKSEAGEPSKGLSTNYVSQFQGFSDPPSPFIIIIRIITKEVKIVKKVKRNDGL